jgi:hypothetical protein
VGTKHGPNRFENFRRTNDKQLRRLLHDGFALSEDLLFEAVGKRRITQRGSIRCRGDIVLEVDKILTILSGHGANAMVQTTEYHYNAYVQARGNLLRYCSPHPHRPYHHVHHFDFFRTWSETAVFELRTERERPTLAQVVDELAALYYEHLEEF